MPRKTLLLSLATAAVLAAGNAVAGVEVAPHRAAYAFELHSSRPGSGVVEVSGGMTYEWADSCDGWAVEQRYLLRILKSDVPELELATSFITWESKDGLRFRFNIKRMQNGREMTHVGGHATLERKGGPGVAEFENPEPSTVPLPAGTVYPTEHMLILLEKAMAGERHHSQQVFDGSEVEGPTLVSAVLLPQRPAPPEGEKTAPLGPQPVIPMQLAFFSTDEREALPEFEMLIQTQRNGVVPAILFDYGDFKVTGTLERLEALPKSGC